MGVFTTIRQHSQLSAGVLGAVLVGSGIILYALPRPHAYTANVLLSIGTSIIAASILVFLSPVKENIYQKLLAMGVVDLYASRRDIQNSQWVDWMRESRQRCSLLGIAHNNWCRDPDFEDTLLDRLRHNVEFEFFFLDPTCSLAEARGREDKPRDTIRTIKESIVFMWDLKQRTENPTRERLKLYVYAATPSSGTLWVDDFMIVTHYLAGLANVTSPAFRVKPVEKARGKDLYGIYQQNLMTVKNHWSTEITEDNVAQYTR
ncbi:MAG TPA: hypothetical protein VGU90_04050 [Terriglobales bacterium]|nr:hypothetical protein [Terriglobales bacterium]